MKTAYYIAKDGTAWKIRKPKSIRNLLDKGYVVTIVSEEGNVTKIKTISPRTREEALKEHRKRFGYLPF